MIDWLNDNSGAVQAAAAVVLALTLIAVVSYAYQTRKQAKATDRMAEATRDQAKATVRMADEMAESRHGNVLPVLDFFTKDDKSGSELLAEVIRIQEGVLPETFHGRIKNIGYGPAFDVRFQTKLYMEQPGRQHVYCVEQGDYARAELVPNHRDWLVYLEPVADSVKRLSVEYNNVYGRAYRAYREVSFDQATGNTRVGDRHTEPIGEPRE